MKSFYMSFKNFLLDILRWWLNDNIEEVESFYDGYKTIRRKEERRRKQIIKHIKLPKLEIPEGTRPIITLPQSEIYQSSICKYIEVDELMRILLENGYIVKYRVNRGVQRYKKAYKDLDYIKALEEDKAIKLLIKKNLKRSGILGYRTI